MLKGYLDNDDIDQALQQTRLATRKLDSRQKIIQRLSLLCSLCQCLMNLWIVYFLLSSYGIQGNSTDFQLHPCVAHTKPIDIQEFYSRRDRLAQLLSHNGSRFDIYVSEPSPNTLYYAGVDANSWPLSERPWLMAIMPKLINEIHPHTLVKSQIIITTPSFELSRSEALPLAIHGNHEVVWLPWQESDNPYDIFIQYIATQSNKSKQAGNFTIQLEENVRQFVSDGLADAAYRLNNDHAHAVHLADLALREQRMIKTDAEINLLQCAADITIDAIRQVRKRLTLGMTEKDAERLIRDALTKGGLTDLDYIVLFGANAALPHATASASKTLQEGEFVLMDVGGQLHGYTSDITRTMLPDPTSNSNHSSFWNHIKTIFFLHSRRKSSHFKYQYPNKRAQKLWETVKAAQGAAMHSLESETPITCAEADAAARNVITEAGYEPYFTHRLGHGYGLQVHEPPFLNSANTKQYLLPREAFTMEPGIYMERRLAKNGRVLEPGIGVRLEDMILKTETGYQLISRRQAQTPWDP